MVMYSDIEYKQTKLIKQGRATINQDFRQLSDWINNTYNVNTLNIIYDTILKEQRPRLQIIFEFEKDAAKFREKQNLSFNFDNAKQQAIANKFKDILANPGGLKKNILSQFFSKEKYKTKDILVVYSSFAPIAKAEAIENIPKESMKTLKEKAANNDVWEIVKAWNTVIFFFYTDKQVEENTKNGVKETLGKICFGLLKPYDEFDYYKETDFPVSLDSKENLDKNYEGNWYYYFK